MTRLFAILAIALLAAAQSTQPASDRQLTQLITPIQERHHLPAMFAAIVKADGTSRIAAVGLRRLNSPEAVTPDDVIHIGSCTKAMTATLAAKLVDRGTFRWDMTVGEAFKDLAPTMHADWPAITLRQLLANHAGAPGQFDADNLWSTLNTFKGTPRESRQLVVKTITAHPLVATPGRSFVYSNPGYTIAGAMIEAVTNTDWETLMRREIFEPLGMTTAGFGAPGSAGVNDQPRGHTTDLQPVEPGPNADNPPAIGPAGTVHCSLGDWGRFCALHLNDGTQPGSLLKPESIETLHTTFEGIPQGYALGWNVARRAWAGPKRLALNHAGSNTMWYCVAWLAPENDFAILIATNVANDEAPKACDEAAAAIIGILRKPK